MRCDSLTGHVYKMLHLVVELIGLSFFHCWVTCLLLSSLAILYNSDITFIYQEMDFSGIKTIRRFSYPFASWYHFSHINMGGFDNFSFNLLVPTILAGGNHNIILERYVKYFHQDMYQCSGCWDGNADHHGWSKLMSFNCFNTGAHFHVYFDY